MSHHIPSEFDADNQLPYPTGYGPSAYYQPQDDGYQYRSRSPFQSQSAPKDANRIVHDDASSNNDPLVHQIIEDWKTVAYGGSINALRDDLSALQKRDSLSPIGRLREQSDLASINNDLTQKHLLPNLEILGVKGNMVLVSDQSNDHHISALRAGTGTTEVVDVKVLPSGETVESDNARTRANLSGETVVSTGATQGAAVPDCKLEALMSSLAKIDPASISKMIKDNADGTYTVTFPGDKDHPETISAPTNWERSTFADGAQEQDWALLIDKAYRQRINQPFGPYGAAPGVDGLLTDHAHDLIGSAKYGICSPVGKAFDWARGAIGIGNTCIQDSSNLTRTIQQGGVRLMDPAETDRVLAQIVDDRMISTSSFDQDAILAMGNAGYGFDQHGKLIPILGGHAYSLMGYDQSRQLVELRNPWGMNYDEHNESTGDGSVTLTLSQFKLLKPALYVEVSNQTPDN